MNNGLKIHHLDRLRKRSDPPSWMRRDEDYSRLPHGWLGVIAIALILAGIGFVFWNIAHAPHDDAFTHGDGYGISL